MEVRNKVLRTLSPADQTALEPDLRPVSLVSGEVLFEPDYPVDWVYFPETAVLSVVTVMADGRSVESDTVGYESVAGVLCSLSSSCSVSRTFIQIPGVAIKVSATRLRQRAEQSPALRKILIRHAYANLAQAHQSVACNALHDLNPRLCRWLLMSQDRTASDAVELTQQYLAIMLGVQRTTVTEAMGDLAASGLVRQERGRIQILDRAGLEAQACECYATLQGNLERLIGEDVFDAATIRPRSGGV